MKLPISFCFLQEGKKNPHFSVLKSVLNAGRAIPVKLEPLIQLETRYANAKAWTDRAAKLLLKKNTTSFLLEVSSSMLLYCGHHVHMFLYHHTRDFAEYSSQDKGHISPQILIQAQQEEV